MGAQSRKSPPRKMLPPRISREDLIARAEKALDDLSDDFGNWMEDEITDLSAAFEGWIQEPINSELTGNLYRCSHDLKGQAQTLGYPIVGRIATSLCELLRLGNSDTRDITGLATTHVETIKAAVRDEVRDETDTTAAAIAGELEAAVDRLYAEIS